MSRAIGHNVPMTSLLTELKRRNVFRVAAAYTIVAWVSAQAIDLMAENFGAPDWFMKMILSLLIIGLPIAAVLAWAYELTPDGVVKTEDVPPEKSVTPATGRKLNVVTTIALLLALAFIAWDKLGPADDPASSAISEKSVAVLPFADLSENQDQGWFADGMTEEILNALARLPELRVTARTSSFEFKNTNIDIGDIADQLGVAHVVEGSIRRIGKNLRVTAQLIRASDGIHLWSETYDSNTEDLFDVQARIAENVAATLDVILDDEKRNRMFASGTRNVAAFEAFLKGRDLYYKAHDTRGIVGASVGLVTLADANVYLDEAIRLDPKFAAPAIVRSDRFAHKLLDFDSGLIGDADQLDVEVAYEQLRANLRLAAENANEPIGRVIAEINQVLFAPRWDRLPLLIEELQSLIDGGANIPVDNVWLQEALRLYGANELARQICDVRIAADPLNSNAYGDQLDGAIRAADYDRADGLVVAMRQKFGMSAPLYDSQLSLYMLRGDTEGAIEFMQNNPPPPSDYALFGSVLPALQGNKELALQMVAEFDKPEKWPSPRLFLTYTALGDRERYQALVSRIDELPAGHAILGMEIANNGGVLWMDLDRAPNFKRRLEEARIDPSIFIPGRWPE